MKIKKFWKRILLALIIVPILIVGGLILYVQSNQSEIIKSEIAKLNEEHEGLVRMGDSKLSLFGNFPYVSIKVYDVQVFETKMDDAPVIMDVKDIYIGFDFWDIVNKNYDIQSLVIEEGVFNLVIHENNTTNIQNALANTSETETPTTNIHLKKIEFKIINYNFYKRYDPTRIAR